MGGQMGGIAEFERYDGLGLAELVRKREVSAFDLVEACIARIEARNPKINAVICKLYDAARRAAAEPGDGPFAGVPFLLKDLMAPLAGVPMSKGNRRLGAVPSDHDGEIVRRYQKAGLIIMGKTNTPEFGLAPVTEPEAFGPARNPWDLSRTPGGSSGGSAAAVAARIVPMAHATDGGGSIRIPASCCGLVGLKPTRGRTPLGPIAGENWRGFSAAHAVTRSVRDSAALLDASAGSDSGAPYEIPAPARPYLSEAGAQPGRLRIGYTAAPFLAKTIHDDCLEGLKAATVLLKDLGHEVVEATPPFDAEPWLMAFMTILAGETSSDIAQASVLAGRRLGFADFEAATYVIGLLGRSWSAGDYAAAANYLQSWSRRVGDFFENYDVLLTPTLAAPPTLIGALKPTPAEQALLKVIGPLRAGWFMKMSGLAKVFATKSLEFIPYTPLFNVTGQPAISLPLHWNAAGLPIGMQFAARMGDEATLVRLAAQLEQASPWFDRTPPGF
jgi:amidase